MKKIWIIMTVLVLCLAGKSWAQFEGELNMNVKHINGEFQETTNMVIYVKDQLMAFDAKEQNGKARGMFIYRGDKKVFWMVNEEEKTYLEVPLDEKGGQPKMHDKKKSPERNKPDIRRTERRQTILGYPCEEIIVKENDETVELWGTEKLGHVIEGFVKAFGELRMQAQENTGEMWEDELLRMKLFPLKEKRKRNDKVIEIDEVTKIESKKLSSSLFEPPAGFKKQSFSVEMNTMMKEMQKNGDSTQPMNKDDLEKMIKELQEKMKQKNEDSTDDDDENNNHMKRP